MRITVTGVSLSEKEKVMKYDLHCHTKEGSVDAKFSIFDFARKLKGLGYDGMLITDHNSYAGYRAYIDAPEKREDLDDFTVLKGIEYDSADGGHVLIILPEGVELPVLEIRGMGFKRLAKLVHKNGGIIGAAHPYGTGYFAIANTWLYKKDPSIMEEFDFVEAYNSGLKRWRNRKARALALEWDKPMTAGSDTHTDLVAGTAYTKTEEKIKTTDDLISYIKNKKATRPIGVVYPGILKKGNPSTIQLGIWGYFLWNKTLALVNLPARIRAMKKCDKQRRPYA